MRRYQYIPFKQLRILYRRRLKVIDDIKTAVAMSPIVAVVVVWMMF